MEDNLYPILSLNIGRSYKNMMGKIFRIIDVKKGFVLLLDTDFPKNKPHWSAIDSFIMEAVD